MKSSWVIRQNKGFPGVPLKHADFDRKFAKARNTKWVDPNANKNKNLNRDIKYKFLSIDFR